jgi:mannosyltransferase
VACALRLFRLGHQSLWIDEALTWLSAGIGQPYGLTDVLENVHGPLYGLGLHVWGSFAGDSEWALRLPSALFGIAQVPAIAWLATRWLGRETAAPAAWLAAGSPFLVWYSQEARNYSMLMLSTTLAAALVLGMRDRLRPAAVAGWTIAALSGALSNLSFLLAAPVQIGWWLAPGEAARARRTTLLAVLGVVLLALLPWAPTAARTWDWRRLSPSHEAPGEEPLRGGTTFHAAAVPFAFYSFAFSSSPDIRQSVAVPW